MKTTKNHIIFLIISAIQVPFIGAMEAPSLEKRLRLAIEQDDSPRAHQVIDTQFSVMNMVYPGTNLTPLLLAARKGRIKMIKLLDDRGVDVEASLVRAVENDDLPSLQLIANTVYKNQNALKNLPSTIDPFQYKNDESKLTEFADHTNDEIPDTFATIVTRSNSVGITPLLAAIQNDNEPIVTWLLQQGISQLEITLIYIFATNNQKIVKKLIQYNPQILNQQYLTIPLLHYTIMLNKFAHAQTLVDEGININKNGGYNNRTALMELILNDNVPNNLVKTFFRHPRINFYQIDYEGNNVLHHAVKKHKIDLIKKIIQHANVQSLNVPNKQGKTPVQLAREYGFVDIHRMLDPKGNDPGIKERSTKRQRRRR